MPCTDAIVGFGTKVIVTGFAMTCVHYTVIYAWQQWFTGRDVTIPATPVALLPPPDIHPESEIIMSSIEDDVVAAEAKFAGATDYARDIMPEQIEAHAAWVDRARLTARGIALSVGEVSSDDVWRECPPPSGVDPRLMGSVFAERNAWELVRYQKSARRLENHGRPISVWRLKERNDGTLIAMETAP